MQDLELASNNWNAAFCGILHTLALCLRDFKKIVLHTRNSRALDESNYRMFAVVFGRFRASRLVLGLMEWRLSASETRHLDRRSKRLGKLSKLY